MCFEWIPNTHDSQDRLPKMISGNVTESRSRSVRHHPLCFGLVSSPVRLTSRKILKLRCNYFYWDLKAFHISAMSFFLYFFLLLLQQGHWDDTTKDPLNIDKWQNFRMWTDGRDVHWKSHGDKVMWQRMQKSCTAHYNAFWRKKRSHDEEIIEFELKSPEMQGQLKLVLPITWRELSWGKIKRKNRLNKSRVWSPLQSLQRAHFVLW